MKNLLLMLGLTGLISNQIYAASGLGPSAEENRGVFSPSGRKPVGGSGRSLSASERSPRLVADGAESIGGSRVGGGSVTASVAGTVISSERLEELTRQLVTTKQANIAYRRGKEEMLVEIANLKAQIGSLGAVLGLAAGQDPVAVARQQNSQIMILCGIFGLGAGEDVVEEARALRGEFEAKMAAKDREHAAALGLLQRELVARDEAASAAQATIADLTAKLAQSESYGAAATDLLGDVRDEDHKAVRDALTAKSTAAGAQAEALEKFVAEPARAPARGPRPTRGYGAADSARQPLLAAEHGPMAHEERDPVLTALEELRARRDALAVRAAAVGSRELTPPRAAVGKKLQQSTYTGTFGLSTSPMRGRGAGATGSIN